MRNPLKVLIVTRTDLTLPGGMEAYGRQVISALRQDHTVFLVSSSGIYRFCKASENKIFGWRLRNRYFNLFCVSVVGLFCSIFVERVISLGIAGVSVGIYKKIDLSFQFGLEFNRPNNSKGLLRKFEDRISIRTNISKFLIRNSKYVALEAEGNRSTYDQLLGPGESARYVILPDPINLPVGLNLDTLARDYSDTIHFISVGRDSVDKNRDQSIDLFNDLNKRLSHVGKKAIFSICVPKKIYIDEYPINENIKVLEGLSDAELGAVRANAHFTINHSDQDVPLLSVLEDLAAGVICISNTTLASSLSNRFAIVESDTGCVFERILHLINNPSAAKEMQQLAFAHVKQNFSAENFSDRLRACLNE